MARGCNCSSPNGIMNIVSAICMTIAWVFNVAAMTVCKFVYNESGFVVGEVDGITITGVGMWSIEDPRNGNCYAISWEDYNASMKYWTDPHLNSARGCGGCAALIGFILFIVMWCAVCCGFGRIKCMRITFGIFSILCCMLAGLMFLFNKSYICSSGSGCDFSTGGAYAVVATVFYFITTVTTCVTPDAEDEEEERFAPPQAAPPATGGGETVSVVKTEQPNGTVIVKETTTHADGSQTVTETTQTPVDVEGGNAADLESMPKAQVE